jgi:SAM-dependent methyltransferase
VAAKAGAGVLRRVAGAAAAARQLAWYDLPGEQRRCPGCGGATVRHLQVLGYTRPIVPARRYGFISGCEQCGLVFANPLPAPALLDETYTPDGKWGRTRPDHEPPVSRDRLTSIFRPVAAELDVLHPPAGAAVLDVGCGLGGMLDTLREMGWATHGIDPGTKVAFNRHRELLTIPDTPQFDLVILHHVLEHVIEPFDILTKLARATRPGGFLLVSVPNLDTLPEHGDLAYCIRSTTHVLAYSRDCLTWLLAAAGFRAIDIDPGDGVPAPGAGSPKAAPTSRQVVVARREDGPLPRPEQPLSAARSALAGHRARTDRDDTRPPRYLPLRVRAAIANLKRSGILGPTAV